MADTKDRLAELLCESRKAVDAMTEDERREMLRRQGKSWARAEMSWPVSRYEIINGVKVYESYGDYCND